MYTVKQLLQLDEAGTEQLELSKDDELVQVGQRWASYNSLLKKAAKINGCVEVGEHGLEHGDPVGLIPDPATLSDASLGTGDDLVGDGEAEEGKVFFGLVVRYHANQPVYR